MNRRQSLLGISALVGHALFPSVLERFAQGATGPIDDWTPAIVPRAARHLLAEIVETIIPTTDTPGAKAARVHVFVDLMLAHCVTADGQAAVLGALHAMDMEAFLAAAPEARARRLVALPPAAFALFKELTILGYFSSEIGATQALCYDPIPGSYLGDVPLRPGQKAWAT